MQTQNNDLEHFQFNMELFDMKLDGKSRAEIANIVWPVGAILVAVVTQMMRK